MDRQKSIVSRKVRAVSNINSSFVGGNLVSDAVRYVSPVTGGTRLSFRVASSGWNRSANTDTVNYVNCVIFGKARCDRLEPYLFKGAHVMVSGELHSMSHRDAEGKAYDTTEIKVNILEIDKADFVDYETEDDGEGSDA